MLLFQLEWSSRLDASEKEKLVLKRSVLGLGNNNYISFVRSDYLNKQKGM